MSIARDGYDNRPFYACSNNKTHSKSIAYMVCSFHLLVVSNLYYFMACMDGIKYRSMTTIAMLFNNNNNNNGRNGIFLRGWLPHRGKAQMILHEDNVLNKFRILKERHVQMRKPYQSPGGLNSRPPAHRSFKHGQGVQRP